MEDGMGVDLIEYVLGNDERGFVERRISPERRKETTTIKNERRGNCPRRNGTERRLFSTGAKLSARVPMSGEQAQKYAEGFKDLAYAFRKQSEIIGAGLDNWVADIVGAIDGLHPVPAQADPRKMPTKQGAQEMRDALGSSPDNVPPTGAARDDFDSWKDRAVAPKVVTIKPGTNTPKAGVDSILPRRPTVRVSDINGSPLVGAEVTFAVLEGNGSITDNDATARDTILRRRTVAVRDLGGNVVAAEASVAGWQLGPEPGTNVLSASIGGKSAFFKTTGE